MTRYDIIFIQDRRVLVKMGVSIDHFDIRVSVRFKCPILDADCSTPLGIVRHQYLPDMLPTTVGICGECRGFGDTHQLQDLGAKSVACLLRHPGYLDAPVETATTPSI